MAEAAPITQEPYIPPAPEVPTPRIPRAEDFPPHVQREIAGHAAPRHEEERGPLSLLRRLASVGLGRREEPAAHPQVKAETIPQVRQAPPRPAQSTTQARAAALQRAAAAQPRTTQRPNPEPAQTIYRPAEGNLDAQGRPLPPRPQDDDLEIPAFLRRQAN